MFIYKGGTIIVLLYWCYLVNRIVDVNNIVDNDWWLVYSYYVR